MSTRSLLVMVCCVLLLLASIVDGLELKEEEGRSRKREKHHQHHKHVHQAKFALPLLLAAVVLKLVVVPMVFKSMAVISIISVILSLMSFFVASVVGYAKGAFAHKEATPNVKFLHYGFRKRDDWLLNDPVKTALNQQLLQGQYYNYLPHSQPQAQAQIYGN